MALPTRRDVLTEAAVAIAAAAFGSNLISSATAAEGSPMVHRIEIRKLKFVPDKLEVRPGDTVIWINHDIAPHTATASDKTWDTGTIKKGEEKSILVTKDMPTDYFCRFHPAMKAKLVFLDGG